MNSGNMRSIHAGNGYHPVSLDGLFDVASWHISGQSAIFCCFARLETGKVEATAYLEGEQAHVSHTPCRKPHEKSLREGRGRFPSKEMVDEAIKAKELYRRVWACLR